MFDKEGYFLYYSIALGAAVRNELNGELKSEINRTNLLSPKYSKITLTHQGRSRFSKVNSSQSTAEHYRVSYKCLLDEEKLQI